MRDDTTKKVEGMNDQDKYLADLLPIKFRPLNRAFENIVYSMRH